MFYGARLALWDLLKIISLLASRIKKWTLACDKALNRLMCYIDSTEDHIMECWFGDDLDNINLRLYADADFAGGKADYKSTSLQYFSWSDMVLGSR